MLIICDIIDVMFWLETFHKKCVNSQTILVCSDGACQWSKLSTAPVFVSNVSSFSFPHVNTVWRISKAVSTNFDILNANNILDVFIFPQLNFAR